MSEGLAVRTNEELAELGRNLVASECFPDTRTAAQAVVKILAGAELGLPPIDAMRSFHVLADGKITPTAALLARAIKASGRYDYRVVTFTDEFCELLFYEAGDEVGVSRFSMDDARAAGTVRSGSAWEKQPRNMLFNRALTNGVAWFAPDVLSPDPPAPPQPPDGVPTGAGVPSGGDPIGAHDTAPPESPEAYGEGATGEVVGSEAESADGGENPPVADDHSTAELPAAHMGPHMWARGEHGLAYCRLEGCFASEKISNLRREALDAMMAADLGEELVP